MIFRHLSLLLIFGTASWAQQDLFTRIVGFDGCDCCGIDKKSIIKTAFQQSWDVMNVIRELHIDWNEASALEYLGPPGFNQPYQGVIQGILNNLGTMNGHWAETPLDWSINVRCDDWRRECGRSSIAYTVSRGPRGIATINFCDDFFGQSDLFDRVLQGQNDADYYRKYDMERYDTTRAVSFLHELLHIDWVYRGGQYGNNQAVVDYEIRFWDPDAQRYKTRDVYGPRNAKILARWYESRNNPRIGGIIARSAENLALYALAKYLTLHLGAYPHYPLVDTEPSERPRVPYLNYEPFEVASNGQVFWNQSYPDDPSVWIQEETETIDIHQFTPDSDYPAAYLTNWNHWANPLTQLSSVHIQNFDGWVRVGTLAGDTPSTQDVQVKVGDSVAIFDGLFTYWSSHCPGQTVTFMYPAEYGDVYLQKDGYLHDSGGNKIGDIAITGCS